MNCGEIQKADDRFCANCGEPSTADPTDATEPEASHRTERASVAVPPWLVSGWGSAAVRALSAIGIGIAIQYAIGAILALGRIATYGGTGGADLGEVAQTPIYMWLGMHGAFKGTGMWLTAIFWIVVAVRLARSFGTEPSTESHIEGSPTLSSLLWAGKIALLYSLTVVAFLVALDRNGQPTTTPIGEPMGPHVWDPASAFFSSLLVVAVAVLAMGLYRRRDEVSDWRIAEIARPAIVGTATTVIIGVGGLLVFGIVGATLERLGSGSTFLESTGFLLESLLVAVVGWAGVDVGFALFSASMGFFPSMTPVSQAEALIGSPGWIIAGTGIAAVAFGRGGYRSAKSSGSRVLSRLILVAALSGLGVAAIFVVSSVIVGSRIPEIQAGIGLSILWTLGSVVGGVIYAQREGLVASAMPTVTVESTTSISVERCPHCGSTVPTGSAFCTNCGRSIIDEAGAGIEG